MSSLELMHSSEGATRREKLFKNIHLWNKNALFKRWHCLQSATPIQPLIIGDNNETLFVSRRLKEKGIWVPAIRPPTVPINSARLRITLNADHTPEMVYQLLHTLKEIETEIDE
jgi:8-amino-7-oxononanoate synthase